MDFCSTICYHSALCRDADKISDLQDEIFDKLNPKPIYTVSELYNKEGNDRFPYDGMTFDQKTYYCNDDSVYSAASSAKSEGVMFYKELSPKTQNGCIFDEDAYEADRDNWLDGMPSISDYLPSWSDYAPNEDDFKDSDGNLDVASYNAAYAAAEEAYNAAYAQGSRIITMHMRSGRIINLIKTMRGITTARGIQYRELITQKKIRYQFHMATET